MIKRNVVPKVEVKNKPVPTITMYEYLQEKYAKHDNLHIEDMIILEEAIND